MSNVGDERIFTYIEVNKIGDLPDSVKLKPGQYIVRCKDCHYFEPISSRHFRWPYDHDTTYGYCKHERINEGVRSMLGLEVSVKIKRTESFFCADGEAKWEE